MILKQAAILFLTTKTKAMENKTAVEWLIDTYFGGTDNITANFKNHIKQALEMEKQQIIDAATWGALQETGEKYYSETYKKD